MIRLTVVIGLSFLVTQVLACECIPTVNNTEQFKKADVVFYAKVISINDSEVENFKNTLHYAMDSLYTEQGGYQPILKVFKTYKGKMSSKEIILKSNWRGCDVFFKRDSEYLIFGYIDDNGSIQTNICAGTDQVTDKNELKKLKEL
tara:strand:- start:79 stop:516 length:438 start_codon:yes stop_codon:yes gene_type:complete